MKEWRVAEENSSWENYINDNPGRDKMSNIILG